MGWCGWNLRVGMDLACDPVQDQVIREFALILTPAWDSRPSTRPDTEPESFIERPISLSNGNEWTFWRFPVSGPERRGGRR